MRGFVRIVQAGRAMTQYDDDLREIFHQTDAAQHVGHPFGSFFERKAE
jgi:hypothetical protein